MFIKKYKWRSETKILRTKGRCKSGKLFENNGGKNRKYVKANYTEMKKVFDKTDWTKMKELKDV